VFQVHFLRIFPEHFKNHKKGGVKIAKTEYAVIVYDKLESKSNEFEEEMVQNQRKNV
jgi:anaerobic ribonucleoside-triphosphate reductase